MPVRRRDFERCHAPIFNCLTASEATARGMPTADVAMAIARGETLHCSGCSSRQVRQEFSKKQLTKGAHRRCKSCTGECKASVFEWTPSYQQAAAPHHEEGVATSVEALQSRRAQLLSELAEVDNALRQRGSAPSGFEQSETFGMPASEVTETDYRLPTVGFEQPEPVAMPASEVIETDDGLRYMGLPPESHWLMTTTEDGLSFYVEAVVTEDGLTYRA